MAITKHDIPDIFQDQEFNNVLSHIQYWQKELDKYVAHIFVWSAENESDFVKLWETVTAKIAVNFQSNLKANIEIWNIYLVILVKGKVSREIKYKVEQDKYSCRKLVEDGLGKIIESEAEIIAILEEKIFKLNIVPKPLTDDLMNSTTAKLLEAENPDIAKLLNGFQSNQQFDKYYKNFKRSQR